jgi:HEAT repeat protein
MNENQETPITEEIKPEEQSFLRVIVHSFFIIPFLIAVFCVILFAGMHLLTRENRTVYDYLEDIKTGALTKRWQGAFELSKILSNPKLLPEDDKFYQELSATFDKARHDDNRIRQYLALAMGRTGKSEFVKPLLDGLKAEKEENLPSLIYALGMLGKEETAKRLYDYIDHPNSRIRSIAIVSIGNIGSPDSIPQLKRGLADSEPNVQWGAAISLANIYDDSGIEVLSNMLNREYYKDFSEIDTDERKNLMISAIDASANLKNNNLNLLIKNLAASDPNMKIRAKAMEALKDN